MSTEAKALTADEARTVAYRIERPHSHYVDEVAAQGLRAYAALLDRSCEGCEFGTGLRIVENLQLCSHPEMQMYVPLTINGRPFSCAGWTAKEGK